jgi:hypothetical protein
MVPLVPFTSTGSETCIGLVLAGHCATVPGVRDPDALTRGLVASDAAVTAGAGGPPPGFRVVDAYVAVPDLGHPQALLPDGLAAAAARSLRRFAQGSGLPARLAALAAAGGVRGGGLRLLRRNRVTVSVAERTPAEQLGELVLRHHLEQALGRHGLQLAVRVGAVRPNGKPVVQVMDAAGEPVGFCKVGWNELTRPLVAGEADALAELAAAPQPLSFSVPRLLERGAWRDFELLLVEAIPERGQPTGADPPVRATGEVANLGGRTRERLAESRWWAAVQARLGAVDHPSLVADARRLGERFGSLEMSFGGCHGDWTPWNMSRVGGRLVVWDWERFGHAAPLGLDLVHYSFMVALRRRGQSPQDATSHVLAGTPPRLKAIGADRGHAALVLMLHQLEMAVRFAEAKAAGVEVHHDLFAEGLHRMLAD